MPVVQLSEQHRTNINHAAYRLLNLISRATSEPDDAGDMTNTYLVRENTASMMDKAATGLWVSTSVDAAAILASEQRRQIQILCAAMACVSMSAAMCAIYWFCMMRRNYRRDLILMLILGDFYKSLWYLIHGSVNFARSQVTSDEVFYQVSGFMLQVGLQACDVAILFISMHMALQIFPPKNSFLGHDGLYKVRHWVLAIWILLPCFTASLAFANPSGAYQAQGAFCWLPIRPFWYRLALSWVPRYLIWLYIMYVAIRIYSHVGYEFRVFGQERDRSSSADLSAVSSAERGAIEKAVRTHRSQVTSEKDIDIEDIAPDDDAGAPRPMLLSRISTSDSIQALTPANAGRRASLPTWHSPFGGTSSPTRPAADSSLSPTTARSNPTSRRGSRQIAPGVLAEDFMAPPGFDLTLPRASIASITTCTNPEDNTATTTNTNKDPAPLPPISETHSHRNQTHSHNPSFASTTSSTLPSQRARHRAIHRQLRILFIYPIIYMLMWLIPFISHCMSYSDHLAQNPIFPVSLLSSLCQSLMGFADVAVFCWRERPWRHVPGSDGTFAGSFAVLWRRDADGEHGVSGNWSRRESKAPHQIAASQPQSHSQPRSQSQTGLLASLRRWSTSRKNSTSPNGSFSTATGGGGGGGAAGGKRPLQKRVYSGGAGRQTRESELAHERLKLEREDYELRKGSLDARRESVVAGSVGGAGTGVGAGGEGRRKEWFDGNISRETLEDDGTGR